MAAMWNPFRRKSNAVVRTLVVQNEASGLHEVHVIVGIETMAEAKDAIAESFDAIVADYAANPDFGGQIVFIVRGPMPGTELPPELAAFQSQLAAKAAAIQTTAGRPFQVRLEYNESPF
jgi:hypothetical protein